MGENTVAEKTLRFHGKRIDLDSLSKQIEQNLITDGYQTQSAKTQNGIVIQAKKDGVLRDIISANRAFTIMISGKPDNFSVRIGIGKFVQNLAVTAAEAILLSELFLAVDVPEMLWTKVVEDGLVKDINDTVNGDMKVKA